jgi:hypothetical protein
VTQHPAVIYIPDIPNYAKTLSDAEHTLIPYGVSDPTVGLISLLGDCMAKSFIGGDHAASVAGVIDGRRVDAPECRSGQDSGMLEIQ